MTQLKILGQGIHQWTMAIVLGAVLFFILRWLQRRIASRLRAWDARGPKNGTHFTALVADLVSRINIFVLIMLSISAAAGLLNLSDPVIWAIDKLTLLALLVQLGIWGDQVGLFWITHLCLGQSDEASRRTLVGVLGYLVRIVVWSMLIIVALGNLGINVTAFITGLGVGGVAVALAVQNILGDLFASLTIALDRPFVVGDSISVDNFSGTIENIGLKTTRMRAASGEQLIFGNTDLLRSRIRNFKRMKERQVVNTFDLSYATSPETLAQVPGMVREIISKKEMVRVVRVNVARLAPSIQIEAVYEIQDSDYDRFAQAQERILLEVYEKFRAMGIGYKA